MRAMLYAQLNPRKTLAQIIQDRDLMRLMVLGALVLVWCV
jgi:hypothetical protein